MKIFIDTWGWLTLQDKREPRYQEVKDFYEDFRLRSGKAFTTDYVLDETIILLFRRLPFSTAKEFLEDIDQAVKEKYLRLEWIDSAWFEKAKELRIKYQDKPRISFTDFTSMVIMTKSGITDILTEDDHFTQVGMGFRRVP